MLIYFKYNRISKTIWALAYIICCSMVSPNAYANENIIRIIPQPNELIMRSDYFEINSDLSIYTDNMSLYRLIDYTATILKEEWGVNANVLASKPSRNAIYLELLSKSDKESVESYQLKITKDGVTISSTSEQGLFYGIQTLRQIVMRTGYKVIPGLEINDSPRFSWRAFMLDEGRHFKGKKQVKKLLDEMARLKMNVFHWHLVDDQGWRIEIKKYPLLTEIGSTRPSTQIGEYRFRSFIQSGEVHEGYYTQDDIREIVAYAERCHITIVPEIEMPGHSSAAIAAYPWLGSSGKKIDVPTVFGVGKDVYNVADPKVFNFLTDVLDEVMDLFPSKVIHIGGDEVKYNHWKESEYVQKYMKEQGLETSAELQVSFTNRISEYLETKGRKMMGWNEISGHKIHDYQSSNDTRVKEQLSKSSIIHFWNGDLELLHSMAEKGFDIVNSLNNRTYLDYHYRGITLHSAYTFDPIPEELAEQYHDRVLGLGCQMWGEFIPTVGDMDFMVFPRIAAYAEVGWTELENKDFDLFCSSLEVLFKAWKEKGIYYAPMEWALTGKHQPEK
jgi:hexosaminidase